MSGLSTAALVALMLTIAFNAFPLINSTDPPQTRKASLNQDGSTSGTPTGAPQNDCTFPTGEVFSGSGSIPAGRSLETIPDSIVLGGTITDSFMMAETLQISDDRMGNPSDPFLVGWYEQTATPAEGGNVVMAGYADFWNVGPTPLASLGTMAEGDEIQVNTPGGTSWVYAVEWRRDYELSEVTGADSTEVLGPTAEPSLTLITCGGEFNYEAGEYLSRTVVRATRQSSFNANAGESTPTASLVASPAVTSGRRLVNAEPRPFTREDCNAEPRTREELIEILSTLPAPVGPGNLTDPQRPLDQRTFDQLQDIVHDYQACQLFGMTLEWTALLSEDELRRMVYEIGQTTPYSPAVLDEIVRGWEEIDAGRSASTPQSEALLTHVCAVVLAPGLPSEGGSYVSDSLISIPAVLAIGETGVVNTAPFQYSVSFAYENGRWQIDRLPENNNCA